MRLLLEHDSDRGESAEKLAQFISDLAFAAFIVGVVLWITGFGIP